MPAAQRVKVLRGWPPTVRALAYAQSGSEPPERLVIGDAPPPAIRWGNQFLGSKFTGILPGSSVGKGAGLPCGQELGSARLSSFAIARIAEAREA